MATKGKAVPEGYHSVTPYLVVDGTAKAIEFYERAFGAKKIMAMPGPGGKIMHAEIKIGDSVIMLGDEFPEMGSRGPKTLGGTPASLFLYVDDVDTLYQGAIAAGATAEQPPQDAFWGDRWGSLHDPFGHRWQLATHKEDLTPAEMQQRAAAAAAGQK